MRSQEFRRISPDNVAMPGLEQAEKLFFTRPYLERSDIKQMAEWIAIDIRHAVSINEQSNSNGSIAEALKQFFVDLAARIQRQSNASSTPVVDASILRTTPEEVIPYAEAGGYHYHPSIARFEFFHDDGSTLTFREISDALEHVRQAVTEELHNLLPEIKLYVRNQDLTGANRVFTSGSDHILKTPKPVHEVDQANHSKALDRLYALRERSPHLLYPTIEHSADWSVEIQRRLNFTNLNAFIYQLPRPPLERVVKILCDGFEGLQFLIEKGFVLHDLALRNIAVDASHNQGALFDYDELYLQTSRGDNKALVENRMIRELVAEIEPILLVYNATDRDTRVYKNLATTSQSISQAQTKERLDIKALTTQLKSLMDL